MKSDGKSYLNGFGVVHGDLVQGDLYTEIYYWLTDASKGVAYSKAYEDQMQTVNEELEKKFRERESARKEQARSEFDTLIDSLQAKADDGKDQIYQGQQEVNGSRQQLDFLEAQVGSQAVAEQRASLEAQQENLHQANATTNQALTQIKELRETRDDFDGPTYYVQDRESFVGYESVKENAEKLTTISNIFPVFFFAIAVLVTWTSIKRMAQEQRNYMGTLKQLCYRHPQILGKFLIYAGSASALGAVFGNVVGIQLFPRVIIYASALCIISQNLFWFIHFPGVKTSENSVSIVPRMISINSGIGVVKNGVQSIPPPEAPAIILKTILEIKEY